MPRYWGWLLVAHIFAGSFWRAAEFQPFHSPGTASICVAAFWDVNQDAQRAEQELFTGGIPIVIVPHDSAVAFAGETKRNTYQCFRVEFGHYDIFVGGAGPEKYLWTTQPSTTDLRVDEEGTISLEYGFADISMDETDERSRIETERSQWLERLAIGSGLASLLTMLMTSLILFTNFKILKSRPGLSIKAEDGTGK